MWSAGDVTDAFARTEERLDPSLASVHQVGLNNGAVRRLTRYGPRVYFPGSSGNEVETAEGDPISIASGEPYTLALPIHWKQNPGSESIFRSGSSSNGDWLL